MDRATAPLAPDSTLQSKDGDGGRGGAARTAPDHRRAGGCGRNRRHARRGHYRRGRRNEGAAGVRASGLPGFQITHPALSRQSDGPAALTLENGIAVTAVFHVARFLSLRIVALRRNPASTFAARRQAIGRAANWSPVGAVARREENHGLSAGGAFFGLHSGTLACPAMAATRNSACTLLPAKRSWSGIRPAANASRTTVPFRTLERARDEIRSMRKARRITGQ